MYAHKIQRKIVSSKHVFLIGVLVFHCFNRIGLFLDCFKLLSVFWESNVSSTEAAHLWILELCKNFGVQNDQENKGEKLEVLCCCWHQMFVINIEFGVRVLDLFEPYFLAFCGLFSLTCSNMVLLTISEYILFWSLGISRP